MEEERFHRLQRLQRLVREKLANADPKLREKLLNLSKKKRETKIQTRTISADFEKFIGFWQATCGNNFSNDLIEFYADDDDNVLYRDYTGTPENWRQYNINDNTSLIPENTPVSLIDSNAVLIEVLISGLPEPEAPYTTFRIQDDGSGILYYVDIFGGENLLLRYVKLVEPPVIQKLDEPSLVNWNNPIEIAQYVYEYYGLVVGPQKADDLNSANYVGREKYDENYQQLLTTGWVRTATTSSAYRGGKYIGVWKTQYPDSFPVTTLHTSEPHKFNSASVLEITGFSGVYSILNGIHRVSFLSRSRPTSEQIAPNPWADANSFEYLIMINVDTSGIVEEYNPLVHGYGNIESIHEAITSETEYRSMIASLYDFVISSFGETTHNTLVPWIVTGKIPETFNDLNLALKDGSARQSGMITRTYAANGKAAFYHNYKVRRNAAGVNQPTMNVNDPFGLGNISDKPEFDIDIDVENYLESDKRFNLFWTVTGDPNAASPVTDNLVDFFGWPSNGNQIVFKVAPFQQVPSPLEDEWGTHPYFYYGYSGESRYSEEVVSHGNFVCGIMKKSKTKNCETVAYIRFVDEETQDGAGFSAFFPTIFGVNGLSKKLFGNETVAMATVLAELNKYNPSKYIIDNRINIGGYAGVPIAWASLFGGNRKQDILYLTNISDDSVPIVNLADTGYESGNGFLQVNNTINETIDTNEAALLFPQSMVRSNNPRKKKQIVFLTSTNSLSSGDIFPHGFIGSDPTATVHDLGFNVESTIVSDINGRLDGYARGRDAVAVNTLNPILTDADENGITPLYLTGETYLSNWDRIGSFNNFTTQVIPDKLLETWYDNTQWRDIGLVKGKDKYPLCKKCPNRFDNKTWRDYVLEVAITHRSHKKCHHKKCSSCNHHH